MVPHPSPHEVMVDRGVVVPRTMYDPLNSIPGMKQQQQLDEVNLNVTELPEHCRRCLECPERSHWYGRLDEAAPPVVDAMAHFLKSIPTENRFPYNTSTWFRYFQDKENSHPYRQYFVEYNPSIVRIHEQQIPDRYRNEGVVYLASFRVSAMHSCHYDTNMLLNMLGIFNTNGTFPPNYTRPLAVNNVALALLREDLSVVTEAIFDFYNLGIKRVEDVRLFNLNDQLYWGSYKWMTAMWLVEPDHPRPWIERIPPKSGDKWEPVVVDTVTVCHSKRRGDKNLQFFVDGDAVIAEIMPMGEKIQVNVSLKCPHNAVDPPRTYNDTKPERSFGTIDELYFWHQLVHVSPRSAERGSASCVRVKHPETNHDLLLGVSHSKFLFRNKEDRDNLPGNVRSNQFFSSFYLTEATQPYSVVAQSGRFYLGFSTEQDLMTQNPYARATFHNKLTLGTEVFDCPAIRFVSGMVDTPDGDHVLIAYGVSDCSSRMIKVRLTDIMQMLFPYRETNQGGSG